GTPAARPTGLSTVGAVLTPADRARLHAAVGADDLLAGGALADARIAAEMARPIQRHGCHLLAAGVASRALGFARIAVAHDLEHGLAFAIAQRQVGHGDRRLQEGIAEE